MSDSHAGPLAHHFEDLEQQHEANAIGMWAFLLSEIMFFGGLFAAYIYYRSRYPVEFAEASSHLDVTLGTVNTAILIGSSLTMALAVRAAEHGKNGSCIRWLVATILLAGGFLGVKAVEYSHKWHEHLFPGASFQYRGTSMEHVEVFFALYFPMTGMHALHMIIGIGLMIAVAWRAKQGVYSKDNAIGVEVLGLYWHFVDLVWIFLFPLLYLLGRHV